MSTITKHGDGFYTIDGIHYTGHKDREGRRLVAGGVVTLAFRRETDMGRVNLDPADVLRITLDFLAGNDHPACEHLEAALETFAAPSNERSPGVSPEGGADVKPERKKPGRKPKHQLQPEAA
jgi:hypothetical protein